MESHSEKAERDLIKPNCVSTAILSRERGAKVSCSLPLQQPRDFHLKVTLINTVHKSHPSPHPAVAIIGPVPGHIRPVNKCVHVCVCVCVCLCVCVHMHACVSAGWHPGGCLCPSSGASASRHEPFVSGSLHAYTVKINGIKLRFK